MGPRLAILILLCASASGTSAPHVLDIQSAKVLERPKLSERPPGPGIRVAVTPPEYAGTHVFHTVYLPPNWKQTGPQQPVIFEYTGNHHPASGSSGEVEDANLGFGLSGGQYIWVSLPYVSHDHKDNATTWWGDIEATVDYAKRNVPRIIKQYNADPDAVFLCGFSRGAIAVNYIGLHDDEIARFWTAFVTHDHFDGVREWHNTTWGSPLKEYRAEASARLSRVSNRPYLVSQDGADDSTARFLNDVISGPNNFTLINVDTEKALGPFPNEFAKSHHNDIWLYKPSEYRTQAWKWMNNIVNTQFSSEKP